MIMIKFHSEIQNLMVFKVTDKSSALLETIRREIEELENGVIIQQIRLNKKKKLLTFHGFTNEAVPII